MKIRIPLIAAFLVVGVIHLHAATNTVTTTADSGAGSLRDALASAANGDTIDATGISGTILLTNGELLVTNSVIILGSGPTNLVVNGNATNLVFDIGSNAVVNISGLKIANGNGGGIVNSDSKLTISNCTISGNSGSGVANYGLDGGTSTVVIINSTISSNAGGGIANVGSEGGSIAILQVINSTISSNPALSEGGGIYNVAEGAIASAVISNSTLIGNSAGLLGDYWPDGGGGIFNGGFEGGSGIGSASVVIVNNTLSGNVGSLGGGLFNDGAGGGVANMLLVSTTLSNNVADLGGGIYNLLGTITIASSSFSSNSSLGFFGSGIGSGIYNDNFGNDDTFIIFQDSTVTGNSGFGELVASNSTLLTSRADVGFATNSLGSLTLSTNSQMTVSGTLTVGSGSGATGTVNVAGGQLTVTNGALGVGNDGSPTNGVGVGTMSVSNGILLASTILLGSSAGGHGEMTLDNGGSITSAGTNAILICNGFGQVGGDLSWTNIGSAMYCGYAHPGAYALSNGTSSCQDMYVGYDNAGTMTIAGGVMSILSRLTVGHLSSPMSTGAVWITGGQLTMVNDYTIIGNSGVGQMTISNGTVTAATVIVGNGGNCGSLTVAGGTLTILTGLTVGDCGVTMTGVVTIAGGNVFVTNAAHNATLDVRNGTMTVSGGFVMVDKLVLTNACGRLFRTGGVLQYSQLQLDPSLSAVGDGIPNSWKLQYGLDPFDPNLANEDPDGDGLSNLREYQLGTDPTVASSPLRITAIAREGNNIRITWTTVGGMTNIVQVTSGTANGSYTNTFSDLGSQLLILGSTVTSTNYLDTNATNITPSRYYRVRLVP